MKTVLFDMDGVITSERIYWNCAGLTVAQIVGEYLEIGLPEETEELLLTARNYLPDWMIHDFKSIGLGNNWDIAYVVSALYLMNAQNGGELPSEVLDTKIHKDFVAKLKGQGITGYRYLELLNKMSSSNIFTRRDDFWDLCKGDFQRFYEMLKDEEEPVIPLQNIAASLNELREMKLRMGIVTGRMYEEIEAPMKKWDLWDYFDESIIITDRDVVRAEKELEKKGIRRSLSKPHPFPFFRAIAGEEAIKLVKGNVFDAGVEKNNYVIVGDSVADAMGARDTGVPMIGVLTGASDEKELRGAGVELIAKDLTGVPAIIKRKWFGLRS